MTTKPETKKIKKIINNINSQAKRICTKMGCRITPSIHTSTRIDENSAQVYPDGKIIFNDEYILLNHKNRKVMHNLITHECAHLADPLPYDGTQHDKSFMTIYQRYGWGIQNDPLYVGDEKLTTPHYALICPKCGESWFYAGKPQKTRYCKNDKTKLKLIDVYTHTYLNKHWRRINNNGNKASKKDLRNILYN